MDVISVQATSEKWGISERRIQKLCEEGRINGAQRMGRIWLIPKAAVKPDDMRKSKKSNNSGQKALIEH